MPARREVSFTSLDQVMRDVDRLLAGHTTVGNWSLGQICNHLAAAMKGSVEGFDVRVPWLFRTLFGPVLKRRILRTGRMPEGVKLPAKALPSPALDDRAEAEALRATIRLYSAYSGPMAAHPFFGPVPRAQWTRLHEIHCAHHLSFLLPMTTS
jgi:hypothetical protein